MADHRRIRKVIQNDRRRMGSLSAAIASDVGGVQILQRTGGLSAAIAQPPSV